jgi:flagellar hook assembly protein FlgD
MNPAAPKYNGIGDCTKATIPPGLQLDSNQTYGYLEIYDYDKNLINIAGPSPLYKDDHTIINFDIYWNGMDRNGKKVDNGKYIAKNSFISKRDTSCMCGEVIIK